MLSFPYTQDEIVRTAKSLFPFLSVGFIIMCACSLITVYIGAEMTGQVKFAPDNKSQKI